ncbi:MAG: hypothetical protein HN742_13410 [Lentisphaerae bacterium]|jgi:alpha-L-fucosidase|nr:hypothetical protein [Lentisphaerota bacterium]MBT4820879.1 hypothetical protein [Lentisphaerota bacterium]MBT5608212.1 hypothetical protein [Lentisphaerota bacterium]MBT7058899.1 hypothetical protein [Lentisphaerota bacterium]MBT7842870.1 hypothetical protein [Lentisphaerota bacterium]
MKINADPTNLENIRWWTEARFGMFVHFGLYALLQRGEWVMYREEISREEYGELLHQFNPSRFDADEWVGLAEDAGARYITITAKHHDGFCLFDSALTDFNITNTPFKRDLIGELVDACRRQDMRIAFYYSQPDWRHVNFVNRPGAFKEWPCARPEDRPNWPKYQAFLEGQVRELCTNYGRIDGIWWDGSHRSEADWRGKHLYDMIKQYQPHAVVNDRARYGDFFTPERSIPELPVGAPCECCQAINTKSWGYKAGGPYWSAPALIQSLVKTASLGANFLLNVGPKPDGTISQPEAERMRMIGTWLKTHGKAIRGTEGCPLPKGAANIRATRTDNTLYLHLLEWPDTDWLPISSVTAPPERARLLGHETDLQTEWTDTGLVIGPLPPAPLSGGVQTVALDFAGKPPIVQRMHVEAPLPTQDIRQERATELGVLTATRDGYGVKAGELKVTNMKGEDGADIPVIANFFSEEQSLTWQVQTSKPATFRLSVVTRISEPLGGSVLALDICEQTLENAVEATTEGEAFRMTAFGTVALPAGVHSLVLQPRALALGYTLGGALRSVVIEPI